MPQDSTQAAAEDRPRIDLDNEEDVRTWAKKFDATPEQIKEAVDAVGDRADEVELHLKGTRSTSNAEAELRGEQRG